MGGTFDPIHLGHLRAAENAREALGLDQVAFVPAGRAAAPRRARPPPAVDRYAMVALATAGHPGFVPSDVELAREGPSYTVDTVAALRASSPGDELCPDRGQRHLARDAARGSEPERLFALCTVAVVDRPGGEAAAARPALPAPASSRGGPGPAHLVQRDLRERVREGRSVRYLVPDAVADYIAKRGLYR